MNIRAIIFDIYGTLLEVGPPPPDADTRWQNLCRDTLHIKPRISRLDFSIASAKIIARSHELAQERDITWPEVHWPSIVAEILPELTNLSLSEREEFLFQQIQAGHSTHMNVESAHMLRWLKDRNYLIGIASNAQAYTLRELKEALAVNKLGMNLFESDLCFWSFEHGFSKPDPHVFQILTVRLADHGISAGETLMIGDRNDNDVEPAKAHGWQAWHFGPQGDGSWDDLRKQLSKPQPKASL
jgi:putative hydrolase of the HAD superfamily